ncbi:ABC transporter ATP-binding protein [Streptomyces sp. JNUCC 64]
MTAPVPNALPTTGGEPLVRVTELELHSPRGPVLDRVSLTMASGECVAVVGASGSGKTTLALALLGLLRPGITHRGGTVAVAGRPSLPDPPPGLRGRTAAYVSQDPDTALNPHQRLTTTVRTALGTRDGTAAEALLERVGLTAALGRRHPGELSGGQQQRGALAVALARSPRLLVLDEPTSSLDREAREEMRGELARLRSSGTALLWITHDLTAVDGLADRMVVLHQGRITEDGPADRVARSPGSAPARRLVAAARPRERTPELREEPGSPSGPPVLEARGLRVVRDSRAVLDGVALAVRAGRALALTGASGAGKSTLAHCLAGLCPPDAGTLLLDGRPLAPNARNRPVADRAAVQLVPQSPAGTLHPGQTVGTALSRPLRLLRGMRDPELIEETAAGLLELVRLRPDHLRRLPGELSGGQRQRAAIARALAARPRVLVCDEMTSALDTVTQASVLELLDELRARESLGLVVITHDPLVVDRIADEVAVLGKGTLTRSPAGHPPGARP